MKRNYWRVFAFSICSNWNKPALTDLYYGEDGSDDMVIRSSYTYGEMCREILGIHDMLYAKGLKKGDHIAICGANSSNWIIAYLAIASFHGIVVTVLPSQSIKDVVRQINFSDAKALFVDSELWEKLKDQSLPQLDHVLFIDKLSSYRSVRKSLIDVLVKWAGIYLSLTFKNPDDLSVICSTSGSTGQAKGVMVAHRVYSVGGALLLSRLHAPSDNRNVMAILPFGHVFGLVDVNSALFSGSHVYILRSLVSPSNVIKIMMSIKPYRMMLIPLLVDGLAENGNESMLAKCQQFLRYGIAGGAIISSQTIDKLLNLKFPLTIGYGQTEASPLISISSPSKYKKGSCGQVIGGCEVRIAPNGEILVKGENVMLGYYKDPEATARKIDKDGWLHTGDKGHLDEEGYLYVEGRLEQDIIVLPNGENIRPDNIESLINALPEVKESIVLAREGKLVAIVVPELQIITADLRRNILRTINPQLPLFSQLYDVEITDQPLARTEKQTIKRYLYS